MKKARFIIFFSLALGLADGQQVAELGKNNWIFPTSWEYHPGKLEIPNADIQQSVDIISLVNQALKSRGTTLVMAVAPAKMRIYPEFLPANYDLDDKFLSRYDRIQNALKSRQIPSADIRSQMLKQKIQFQKAFICPKIAIGHPVERWLLVKQWRILLFNSTYSRASQKLEPQ